MTTSIIIYQSAPDYFALLRGPWTIRTKFHSPDPNRPEVPAAPKAYALCYQGRIQYSTPAYPHNAFITPNLGRMIRECTHLNSIAAEPIPRVQCAADAPNPQAYIASLAKC